MSNTAANRGTEQKLGFIDIEVNSSMLLFREASEKVNVWVNGHLAKGVWGHFLPLERFRSFFGVKFISLKCNKDRLTWKQFLNIFCRSQNGDQLFLAEPRSRRHIHHNLLHSEPGKDRNHTFLFPEEREIEFLTHLNVYMNTNFITFMKTLQPVINFLIFERFDKNCNIHQQETCQSYI